LSLVIVVVAIVMLRNEASLPTMMDCHWSLSSLRILTVAIHNDGRKKRKPTQSPHSFLFFYLHARLWI